MRWNVPMLFLLVVSAGGQQNIPGALAQDYIASFNGGEEPMRKFFQRYGAENVPLEARIARFRELKADMGSLKVRKIEVTTPDAIRLDAESASGEPVTLVLHLSGGAAAKLGSVEVRRGPPDHDDETPGPPLQARAEPDALRDIEALVKSTAASDKFSGAVLVARGESILWEGAYGYAHKETKSSNTTATKFNIGSIGKSFTSTAVAQLAAQGKLGLDDTIGKYLPDYPNRTAAEKVTIRHLLAMQSGIGDFFGPRYQTTPKNELRSLADYLKLFADQPLAFEPGQGRQYSNGGFVVLGLIIEKASGMSYYDYVQKHIFDVAGMRDTGLFEQDDPIENRATGYTLNFGAPRRANVYTLPERASSAGGAYSTLRDLLAYARALEAGKLASSEALRANDRPPGPMGIAGGAPGLNASLDSGVHGRYTLIVLSNYDPPSAESLSREVRRVLNAVQP